MGKPSPAADGGKQTRAAKGLPKLGKQNYRKDKPWDTPDIDHWKIDPMTKDDNPHGGPIEESNFKILFPKYLESYLREGWDAMEQIMKSVGVSAELNLSDGVITVRTTKAMYDPFAILNARDFCKAVSRSVPVSQAKRIIQDDNVSIEIIKIGGFSRNQTTFVKRRARLVGPQGATQKALELLLDCFFKVHGSTCTILGPWKRMKMARRVVIDCMSNKLHPVYHIKTLMTMQELEKMPGMEDVSWKNYLPDFKAAATRQRRSKGKKDEQGATMPEKGPHKKPKHDMMTPTNIYPKPPTPRKEDIAMDTGDYFLSPKQKLQKRGAEARERQAKSKEKRQEKRADLFKPPKMK